MESPLLLLAFILIPLGLVLTIVIWTALNGIGPLPTTPKQKRAMFAALPKAVQGTIYELGSGWGGLARALARQYPDCRVVAVENSPLPFLYSWLIHKIVPRKNLEFRWRNIQKQPLSDAALIVSYLHTGAMERLRQKLEVELNSGNTWIVSNTFSFHGWTPERVLEIGDVYKSKVFVYRR